MKNSDKFKYQIEANTLRRLHQEDDELVTLAMETKPSRLDNKRLRDNKHELAKEKKFNRWH